MPTPADILEFWDVLSGVAGGRRPEAQPRKGPVEGGGGEGAVGGFGVDFE